MSDFTQEFTRKVQNSVDVRGSSNGVKRKIDKRWFILAALLILFIVLLVLTLTKDGGEAVSYNGTMVNVGCGSNDGDLLRCDWSSSRFSQIESRCLFA